MKPVDEQIRNLINLIFQLEILPFLLGIPHDINHRPAILHVVKVLVLVEHRVPQIRVLIVFVLVLLGHGIVARTRTSRTRVRVGDGVVENEGLASVRSLVVLFIALFVAVVVAKEAVDLVRHRVHQNLLVLHQREHYEAGLHRAGFALDGQGLGFDYGAQQGHYLFQENRSLVLHDFLARLSTYTHKNKNKPLNIN